MAERSTELRGCQHAAGDDHLPAVFGGHVHMHPCRMICSARFSRRRPAMKVVNEHPDSRHKPVADVAAGFRTGFLGWDHGWINLFDAAVIGLEHMPRGAFPNKIGGKSTIRGGAMLDARKSRRAGVEPCRRRVLIWLENRGGESTMRRNGLMT